LAAKGANARQLDSMFGALRIEIGELAEKEPEILHNLRRACTVCNLKPECDRNIAAKTLAANYRAYCPNATILKKLQQDGRFTSAA
jgi:hypothetical protein